MVFQGKVQSVAALLEAARTTPETNYKSNVGIRHTAAQNASMCNGLLAKNDGLETCWRFGILQTLDDYNSVLRRGDIELAAKVFTDEPSRTGAVEIDAAFAALADFLAQRDGWPTPPWAQDETRKTDEWYPSVPKIFHAEAKRESPEPFRQRGIFITHRSLARA